MDNPQTGMSVTVDELAEIACALFTHLKQLGYDRVDLDVDYYWNIPKERVYDPYTVPGDFDLGQISDDLVELRRIIRGEMPAVGSALVWLASVLRAVGEKTVG